MASELQERIKTLGAGLAPILVLVVLVFAFLTLGGHLQLPGAQVPLQDLTIQRIEFHPDDEIRVHVINGGPTPVKISQVMVNENLREAFVRPSNEIPRLGNAEIVIPFFWNEGYPYEVTILTSAGFEFSKGVEAAVFTPQPALSQFVSLAIVGGYVGILPIFLGFSWLPFMRKIGEKWFRLFNGITIGLLIFIGVDALEEAFEQATVLPGTFQGVGVITGGVIVSFLILQAVGAKSVLGSESRENSVLTLAYLIALGIGLHNLGEGLAIGSAYALGEIALGTSLVIGFTIHNTTEGIAILAPIANKDNPIRHYAALGLLAGAPAILGGWIGGFIFSNLWATFFFAVAAGAVFTVVSDVADYLGGGQSMLDTLSEPLNLLGVSIGLLVMYLTGLLIAV